MKTWPAMSMAQVTRLVTDGKHGDCEDEKDSGYYFLSSKDLRNGRLHYDRPRQITHSGFLETHRRTNLEPGDILLANCGASIGRVGLAQADPRIYKTTFQKSVSVIKANTSIVDKRFLYYFVTHKSALLIRLGNGAAQPNLLIGDLKRIEVPVPPLPLQRRIAGILSAYDELIDNNQRRIEILESMTRGLYRETIQSPGGGARLKPVVDCDYWRLISENVGKYAGTKRYYATADVDDLAITGAGIEYSFSDKPSRAQKLPLLHSVWFARMKDTYKIAWFGAANARKAADSILSSGFAGFEARDPDLWPLLFLTVSSKEFHVQKDRYCTGATQVSLTNEGLRRIELPVPEEESARRLGKAVGPMLNALLLLQQGNEVLRRTRDRLLPRLLSGQIEVEAA